MASFDPAPAEDALESEREAWAARHDTRSRVRQVITGTREPVSAAEIADRARCSTNAARKYLDELAEERLVLASTGRRGARYRRNDEYFRWRRAFDLSREHPASALVDRLSDLEGRTSNFRDRFGAASPDEVDFPPEDVPHEDLHDLWEALNEWESVRREVSLHEDALRLSRRRSEEPHPTG